MLSDKDQMTMLKIKSLLNYLRYVIKDDDLKVVDEYHELCRKECSFK